MALEEKPLSVVEMVHPYNQASRRFHRRMARSAIVDGDSQEEGMVAYARARIDELEVEKTGFLYRAIRVKLGARPEKKSWYRKRQMVNAITTDIYHMQREREAPVLARLHDALGQLTVKKAEEELNA